MVNKNTNKNSLTFQLTSISAKLPTLKDKKIHNVSLKIIVRKRKISMPEPSETIIIRAQQNFKIVGGLNPIQIEIEGDRVVNMLKKHKKCHVQINTVRDIISCINKKLYRTGI